MLRGNIYNGKFNQEELDALIEYISGVFLNILNNGHVDIEISEDGFIHAESFALFETGIRLMQEVHSPDAIELVLSHAIFDANSRNTIDSHLIFELLLIKKLVLLIQQRSAEEFISMTGQLAQRVSLLCAQQVRAVVGYAILDAAILTKFGGICVLPAVRLVPGAPFVFAAYT